MKIYAAIANENILGWNVNAVFAADDEADTWLFSNGNSKPVFITLFNPTGATITYDGSPVESLELGAGEQFIGLVKAGNITPQHGKLTPIPLVEAPLLPLHADALPIIKEGGMGLTFDTITAYQKAQRKELQKIRLAQKALRDAKKLSKEQEEDI